MIVKRIKKKVKHQGIGGKEFVVDENITETLSNNEVFKQAITGNYACKNFIERRPDFNTKFDKKLYYGHVGVYGYIIAEDELED